MIPILRQTPTWEELMADARPHNVGVGIQSLGLFPNGYGYSLVQFRSLFGGSYGVEQGLYELAVIRATDSGDLALDYDNPVANGDVVGRLTPEEVVKHISRIAELPRKGEE